MNHRDVRLTEQEREAALVGYAFVCLAWACAPRAQGVDFYEWLTSLSYRARRGSFEAAVLWAMRFEQDRWGRVGYGDDLSADDPAGWLGYVEHVVGYRCGPGNGHGAR